MDQSHMLNLSCSSLIRL